MKVKYLLFEVSISQVEGLETEYRSSHIINWLKTIYDNNSLNMNANFKSSHQK